MSENQIGYLSMEMLVALETTVAEKYFVEKMEM